MLLSSHTNQFTTKHLEQYQYFFDMKKDLPRIRRKTLFDLGIETLNILNNTDDVIITKYSKFVNIVYINELKKILEIRYSGYPAR